MKHLRTVALGAMIVGLFIAVANPSSPSAVNVFKSGILLADGGSPPPTCNPFTQVCPKPNTVEVADGGSPPPTCNPFTQVCPKPNTVEVADGGSPPPTCNPFTQVCPKPVL